MSLGVSLSESAINGIMSRLWNINANWPKIKEVGGVLMMDFQTAGFAVPTCKIELSYNYVIRQWSSFESNEQLVNGYYRLMTKNHIRNLSDHDVRAWLIYAKPSVSDTEKIEFILTNRDRFTYGA